MSSISKLTLTFCLILCLFSVLALIPFLSSQVSSCGQILENKKIIEAISPHNVAVEYCLIK